MINDWSPRIIIEFGYVEYFSVFEALDVVLWLRKHLRSCDSTRASLSSKIALFRCTGDDLWQFYCFGVPRRRFWAWEPSEELRLDGSFHMRPKMFQNMLLVTMLSHCTWPNYNDVIDVIRNYQTDLISGSLKYQSHRTDLNSGSWGPEMPRNWKMPVKSKIGHVRHPKIKNRPCSTPENRNKPCSTPENRK